ncbi:MAG: hypothetical protein D8M58_06195 [Calditrichaeota bacterium]|nr:MAG: hypothetical protein DWQ03_20310 [Calditrichota bacterium]MBL1204970.1 hypothetical protein [Calditrichota bacterium]NOG44800.1 hypothetical protein [Calditrichota bacterium]
MTKNILCIIFVLHGFTFSNDSVFKGSGVNVTPEFSSDVQMVHETIEITERAGPYWDVFVDATFKNYGDALDLQIGFPFRVYNGGGDIINYPSTPDSFKVFVNDKEYPFKLKNGTLNKQFPDIKYAVVYTFNVHFEPGESKRIKHTYSLAESFNSVGSKSFEYILQTGSLWKGDIEKIDIKLKIRKKRVPEFQIISPKESNCYVENNYVILEWNFTDINPEFNLSISSLPDMYKNKTLDWMIEAQYDVFNHGDFNGVARYFRNLVFAHYGYPFKNPFFEIHFYDSRSFSKNENYSFENISSKHKDFIDEMLDITK